MTRARSLVVAAALAGAALLLSARPADAADIRVCENSRMRPPCVNLQHGVNDLSDWGISNSISSFSIGSGRWMMCTEPNFGGRCEVFSEGRDNLQGTTFQDRISSLRPVRGGGGGNWGGWGNEEQWRRIGIAVYTDADYRGRSWVFTDDVRNLKDMGLRNQVSSLRVIGGRWSVCRNPNFGGCIEVNRDIPNLRSIGFNDQISSIRELGPGSGPGGGGGGWGGSGGGGWGSSGSGGGGRPQITVFRDFGFAGPSRSFDSDQRDLASMGLGNSISSLRISGGRWRVCKTPRMEQCFVLDRDVADLRQMGFNDQINAFELVRSGGDQGGDSSRDEAILYEQPGFRGRSVTVSGESSNLRNEGFNDRAMSIRLRGTWQLCSDANYRGSCVSVRGDQSDLTPYRLSRNLSSLRKER
jgi:hypothetical protein